MTKRRMSTENDRPSVSTRPMRSAAEQGAAVGADAADDDDDERENEDVIAHPRLDRQDGGDHDAGKAREHGAEAEHGHEQAPDIDAERGYHRRVGRAGAHQHADAGV